MFKLLLSNILMLSLLVLTSCGDLKKAKEPEAKTSQFITCELDSSAFTKILRKRIQSDLSCLESNLILFINIVETDAPGKLSESHLKTFIRANVPEIEEQTISALSAVFDLSSVLFGDKKGYIKRENIPQLILLLKEVNASFVDNDIYEYFTTTEKISFDEHDRRKSIIYNTLNQIGLSIHEKMKANSNSINLTQFIDYFQGSKPIELLEDAKTALFIKKAILGGEADVISFQDMNRLSMILQDLSKIVYDFAKILEVDDLDNDELIISILKEDVKTVISNFYFQDKPNEEILSFKQFMIVLETFAPKAEKYFKYEESILKIKNIFFGNNSKVFTAGDFLHLFEDIFLTNLERGVVFYRSFRENEKFLEINAPIKSDLSNSYLIGREQHTYQDDFNRIISQYRFFKGTREVPLFGFDHVRNRRAVFEISFFEDMITRVFKTYGSRKEDNKEEYVLSLEQLRAILEDFKPLLVDFGLVHPDRISSTSNTVTLMTSLFHFQSNGDSSIEVPEFVEFLLTMMSSLSLSDDLFTQMKSYCLVDDAGKYDPQCFRDNFRKVFEQKTSDSDEGVSAGQAVPELKKYLESLNDNDYQAYLKKTAKFSRTCSFFNDGTEVPMVEGDGLVTWAGLLAIEQTMLRYDLDQDSLLSPAELKPLYETFKPALEAILPGDFLKKRSFKIFQYIVKFKRIPDVSGIKGPRSLWRAVKAGSHFGKFLYITKSKNRESYADRFTFAAVLEIIQEQTPTDEEAFDCESLR